MENSVLTSYSHSNIEEPTIQTEILFAAQIHGLKMANQETLNKVLLFWLQDLSLKVNVCCKYFSLLLLWLLYTTNGKDFCFDDNNEGHRLNSTRVLKRLHTNSGIECILVCFHQDESCRSINFRKNKYSRFDENCELLHETPAEKPGLLVVHPDFDHYILLQPMRVYDSTSILCSCPDSACLNDGRCIGGCGDKSSFCQCSLPYGGKYCQLLLTANSCTEWYKLGARHDGTYTIYPDDQGGFKVTCDMMSSGGGWTIFQRRLDGSVDFYRGWDEYSNGFGDTNSEIWLGLHQIHRLTQSERQTLRIDMEDFDNNSAYAQYEIFSVGSEEEKFKLTVDRYSGNAGDSLSIYHNNMKFSTKDADHDTSTTGREVHCAQTYHGGWWYKSCHESNLNGKYYYGGYQKTFADGINWFDWHGYHYSLKKTEMKMRRRPDF